MQQRHKDRKRYFDEQAVTTEKYVIPYIAKHKSIGPDTSVLEIGCGEGGNLKPFVDHGCQCAGIDLNQKQIENANRFFASHPNVHKVSFVCSDIYDITPPPANQKYDVIIMRDVIEHIHNQEKFMGFLKGFLKKDGVVFCAFPPWYMPFGGHQQICKGRVISKLPYVHLLSNRLYSFLLKKNGETDDMVNGLLEIKETGITLERFERICRDEHYRILDKTYFFINPNYEVKFRLKPRRCLPVFREIPYLRDFYVTAGYYLIENNDKL